MKISVALCTYNGAQFLAEQLQSIAAQERLPDEVVIGDDLSGDATPQIIARFAESAPFAVRWQRNERNLGSTENFAQTLARCSGDIIVLCDQDDVWRSDKLQLLAAAFAPRVGFAFSDADVVDTQLNSLGYRLWSWAGFDEAKRARAARGEMFEVLLDHNVVTGATMAFLASFRDLVLPIPGDTHLIHDGWIALLISAVADSAALPEPLIQYRQHAAQQAGTAGQPGQSRVWPREHYAIYERQLAKVHERLDNWRRMAAAKQFAIDDAKLTKRLRALAEARIHVGARIAMPQARLRRLPVVLREWSSGRYGRHSNGWRSAARDLLF